MDFKNVVYMYLAGSILSYAYGMYNITIYELQIMIKFFIYLYYDRKFNFKVNSVLTLELK